MLRLRLRLSLLKLDIDPCLSRVVAEWVWWIWEVEGRLLRSYLPLGLPSKWLAWWWRALKCIERYLVFLFRREKKIHKYKILPRSHGPSSPTTSIWRLSISLFTNVCDTSSYISSHHKQEQSRILKIRGRLLAVFTAFAQARIESLFVPFSDQILEIGGPFSHWLTTTFLLT